MRPFVHTLITALLAIALVTYLLQRWWRYRQALDLRYAQAVIPWLVLECMGYLMTLGWLDEHGRTATRVVYQLLIFGVTVFLLTTVTGRTGHGWPALIAVAQLVTGLICAPLAGSWAVLWDGVNVASSVILVLMLAYTVWGLTSSKGWLVLLMAVVGVGVMLTDLRAAGAGPVQASVAHDAYALGLFVLWRALTQRLNVAERRPHALSQARRQLAQDLHDGVGAQLACIILALDLRHPTQRATAVSLQHCLMTLKLLVDAADHQASVLGHLASLRYRMQPLLELISIELHWEISGEDSLEKVRGDAAHQILHIAQEALANAMRHAHATRISVTCQHLDERGELLLEVADNGIGMPAHLLACSAAPLANTPTGAGKGVLSMRRRAQRLGGYVVIESIAGQGTRVRLIAPLKHRM
jgi:signal transduction histidine kinase